MKPFKQFLQEGKKKEKLLKQIKKQVKAQGDSPIVELGVGTKPNSKERQAAIDYMIKNHGVRELKQQVKRNAA